MVYKYQHKHSWIKEGWYSHVLALYKIQKLALFFKTLHETIHVSASLGMAIAMSAKMI